MAFREVVYGFVVVGGIRDEDFFADFEVDTYSVRMVAEAPDSDGSKILEEILTKTILDYSNT